MGYGTVRFDIEIENLFKKVCNESNSTRTMMDEAMVSKHASPLLLQQYFS